MADDKVLAITGGASGIGLAIVRKGAERLGGGAGAESDGPGRGSRFWIELPGVGA